MTLQNILFGAFVAPKTSGSLTHRLADESNTTKPTKKKRPATIQNRPESNEFIPVTPSVDPESKKGKDRIFLLLDTDEWASYTTMIRASGMNPTTVCRILNELIADRKAVKKVVALQGNVRRWYYRRRNSTDTQKVYSETMNRDAKIISALKSRWFTKDQIKRKFKLEGKMIDHAFARIRQQHLLVHKIEVKPVGRVYYFRIEE